MQEYRMTEVVRRRACQPAKAYWRFDNTLLPIEIQRPRPTESGDGSSSYLRQLPLPPRGYAGRKAMVERLPKSSLRERENGQSAPGSPGACLLSLLLRSPLPVHLQTPSPR